LFISICNDSFIFNSGNKAFIAKADGRMVNADIIEQSEHMLEC